MAFLILIGGVRPPPTPRFFVRLLLGFVAIACKSRAFSSTHPASSRVDPPPLRLSSGSGPATIRFSSAQLRSSSASALICIPAASKAQTETHATCTARRRKANHFIGITRGQRIQHAQTTHIGHIRSQAEEPQRWRSQSPWRSRRRASGRPE